MWSNNLNCLKKIVLIMMLFFIPCISVLAEEVTGSKPAATFTFTNNIESEFLDKHKTVIKTITENTIAKVRKLMPELAESIHFTVLIINRDLSIVNGMTGRADKPTEIEISFSSIYQGGIDKAIEDSLEFTLFHELHHTVRGWTIYGNKFGPGIDTAAINEGLADTFAEIQAGQAANNYTDAVNYDAWTKEILTLPRNANYGEWMFRHPDGREAIGYRTGSYLIKKAMKNSNKNILELSKMTISDIYELAGY